MLVNKVKEKAARGEVTYGTLLSFPSTDLVRFFGLVGYDWVFIDAEHDPVSPETVSRLVDACHLVGITPFVRVPESTPGTILRFLEAGADGVIPTRWQASTSRDTERKSTRLKSRHRPTWYA